MAFLAARSRADAPRNRLEGEHNVQPFCDALTMVKTTNYGELMTGQDVLKFPCISDSVFCIIWCWGNFEQKLTSLTQKSRRLQDFYFRVNFHSRLGANISPLHSLRSFENPKQYYENITNQAKMVTKPMQIYLCHNIKRKKAKKMHFTV